MKPIYRILIAAITLVSVNSNAQSLWTEADFKMKITKNLSASVGGEYRTFNKLDGTERWVASAAVDYSLGKYLKIGALYSFIYRHVDERITNKGNIVSAYWQPRQRFAFSITGSYRWNRFTFSLRERYQYTHHKSMFVEKVGPTGKPKDDEYIEPKNRNLLRSRLKAEYTVRKTGFVPFVSVEIYNDLKGFDYNKSRYTIGSEYKINSHNTVELYYRYIDRSDSDENGGNVIGVGYQFKF